MIQLDRHIEILLLDNDCVIVPGFGGFMAHHVCAEYNADSQSFTPPMRQLCFNAQLKINDSLLAQSYIEAYDISYPEAIRRIEEEVTQLKQQLQNDGYCELNDIGVLRTNVEGNIEFEPCESGILTPDLYGLNTVDMCTLDTLASQAVVAADATTNTVAASQEILNEIPKPNPQLAISKDTDGSEEKTADTYVEASKPATISIRISTIKHVAAVAAVIAALFVCSLPLGKINQETNPELAKSSIDTGVLYKILPDEAPKQNLEAFEVEKDSNIEEVAEATTTETEDKAEPELKSFHSIVLASRVTKTNAEVFVEKLKNNGYTQAEVVLRPSGGVKVIYGHFASEEEARNNLNSLRDSSELFAEGWIMEFNN